MSTKCILVVDEDVDVQDIGEVTLKVLNNIDPERDIQFTLGPVDSLDHASRLPDFGSKMGVDATRKWPSEGFTRPWPDEIRMDEKTKARGNEAVEGIWAGVRRLSVVMSSRISLGAPGLAMSETWGGCSYCRGARVSQGVEMWQVVRTGTFHNRPGLEKRETWGTRPGTSR